MTVALKEEARCLAILDAAAQLIAERGYHSVRVSDIAAAVGTSSGAVHYWFPGRSDVLTAALRHALDRAFERQSAELKQIDDAHKRLIKLIDMQLPRVGPVRDEWSIWLQFWSEANLHAELRPLHNSYYARWHGTVVSIVKRGQQQRIFRPNVDPETVAYQLTGLTDGLAIQVLTSAPNMTVTAMKEILIGFVHDSLVTPL